MSEPSEADLKLDLHGHWLSIRAVEAYSNAHYEGHKKAYLILGAVIRRANAAETERDRLAERLKRAEGLLRRLAKPCRCGKPGCGFHDAAAFLAESNSTEKKA